MKRHLTEALLTRAALGDMMAARQRPLDAIASSTFVLLVPRSGKPFR